MKTRQQIITEMCLIVRPDFHTVLAIEDNDFGVGITPIEQEKLRSTMAQILDTVIVPNIGAVKNLGD